jgi:hypothetical protein
MSKFTDHLWSDLVREHGAKLAYADRPELDRARGARILRRPRVLAGSTLGLAGVGAALILALGAASSPPAYAITTNDGSVLVTLNHDTALPQANAKLAAMGTHEQITISMQPGAATVSGPVTCTRQPGVSGPTVKVLNGANGTYVVPAGNTGAGSWHLAACSVTGLGSGGNTGNTGVGTRGTSGIVLAPKIAQPLPAGSNAG